MEIPLASAVQPGRPTLRDAETLDRLCGHIRQFGATDNAAAAHAGLHRTTLWRWKQIDPTFELRLTQAREQFRCAQLTIVMEGGRGWRAATWLLERVFPGDYHPRAAERARHKLAEAEAAEAATTTPATPTASPEPMLQNPTQSAVKKAVTPVLIPPTPSEPLLQNPTHQLRPMSRKARRAVERNQQRAERQRLAATAAA